MSAAARTPDSRPSPGDSPFSEPPLACASCGVNVEDHADCCNPGQARLIVALIAVAGILGAIAVALGYLP